MPAQALPRPRGDQNLESLVPCQIEQDAGIVRIILDDQQDGIVGLQIVPIIGDLLDRMLGNTDEPPIGRKTDAAAICSIAAAIEVEARHKFAANRA